MADLRTSRLRCVTFQDYMFLKTLLMTFQVPPFVVLATSENADQSQQIWMPDTFFQNEKWVVRLFDVLGRHLATIAPNAALGMYN